MRMNVNYYKVVYEDNYRGLPIDNTNQGCYAIRLDRIFTHLADMRNRFTRVFAYRFDVRFPEGYDAPWTNECIGKFAFAYVQESRSRGVAVHYVWRRHEGEDDCCPQRYDFGFLINAMCIESPYALIQAADRIWCGVLQGHYGERNGYVCEGGRGAYSGIAGLGASRDGDVGVMIDYGNMAEARTAEARAFYLLSQIARADGGRNSPFGARSFGASVRWYSAQSPQPRQPVPWPTGCVAPIAVPLIGGVPMGQTQMGM